MQPEINLLSIARGSITAPAGCGKTQLIANSLQLHTGRKPILVLTHTNAGVFALSNRLRALGVPSNAYRLSTIDGFSIRLASKFPARSGIDPRTLDIENPGRDYPLIRDCALRLLSEGHVNDVIISNYAGLLIDEYQDCNQAQHAISTWLSTILPTCVLGDPLQAIFGFGGNRLVDWRTEVQTFFPPAGELRTPWRWIRANTQNLGNWLLNIRDWLANGHAVDLRNAPQEVQWVQLHPDTAIQQRQQAARVHPPGGNGSVLIIGDSRNPTGQRQFASQTPGATAVERVDLGDLTNFAKQFDLSSRESLNSLLDFASSLMTGVGQTEFLRRVDSITNNRARIPPSTSEIAAIDFLRNPTYGSASTLLQHIAGRDDVRVYRPELLRCCLSSLTVAHAGSSTFFDACIRAREMNRHRGRPISRRSVGSTLLLKGLESEVAVILHPESMSANHLYVALTRGSQRVVVCSETPLLRPN